MTKQPRSTKPAVKADETTKNAQPEQAQPDHKNPLQRRLVHYKRLAAPILRRAVKQAANSPIPAILLIASVLFARYMPNSDFSYPSEIFLPITLFGLLSVAAFYIYRWSFRGKSGPAHVATFLLIYSLYAFAYAFPYVQKWTKPYYHLR